MNAEIGFIGLGVMGQSMARNLLDAGNDLYVYTRTASKATPLLERGAKWGDSPIMLAQSCRLIFTMVGFPQDVEAIYLGKDGLIENIKPGTILVDMTTSDPALAVRLAKEAKRREGCGLDAPVSGGDKGARSGTLSIMVGGERATFESVLPFFECMGETIVYQGPAGSGQHCKLCNQMAIAANMLGVCESIAYAQKAGLDPETVLKTISSGAAGSWSLSNLAPRMLKNDFEPGFFVKHFIKDMTLASAMASRLGLKTPGLDVALQCYRQLAEQGNENDGTQALYKLYQ